MAHKRTSDAVAVVPEAKRSRNELIPLNNKDKALMELVCSHNLTIVLDLVCLSIVDIAHK